MQLRYKLRLAGRYLRGHFRRYIFLLIALSFGFSLITALTSISNGMIDNVYTGAETHYGGHLFILGFDKDHDTAIRITDDALVSAAVAASDIEYEKIVRRTNCFERGVIYFNGKAVRQKNVFGIDIENETDSFPDTGFDAETAGAVGLPWIMLSKMTAEELHLQSGDKVILEVETITGQKNTAECLVTAVMNDSSLFGSFRSFTDRRFLNDLMGMAQDEYSSMGLYFRNLRGIGEKARRLQAAVETVLPAAPEIAEKADLTYQLSQQWPGIRYFVVSLPVYMSEIVDLISALEAGSYAAFAVLALILLASSLVTYRLLLHERRTEIATMRALGFHGRTILNILFFEGAGLAVISVLIGYLLSRLIIMLLSLFSYGSIPGFEIFLNNGRLTSSLPPELFIINIAVVFATVGLAMIFPAGRSVRHDLAKALSGGDF